MLHTAKHYGGHIEEVRLWPLRSGTIEDFVG
jgi:hypothetical protein